MSAYLKMGRTLPAGVIYKSLTLNTPNAIRDLGGATTLINFTQGLTAEVGTPTVMGSPVKGDGGYLLGPSGYLDTNTNETSEFTWIVLHRAKGGMVSLERFASLITSWYRETVSGTGFSEGNNLGQVTVSAQTSDTANTNFNWAAATPTGSDLKYCISALTRKQNVSGGYTLSFCSNIQKQGVVNRAINGSATLPKPFPVYIGHAVNSDGIIVDSKAVLMASIHNKGLTSLELTNLVNAITQDLETQGILF